MAGKVNIRDFFLKLGFDSSEVEKGLKKLDKELLGVTKKLTAHSKAQESANKKVVASQKKKSQAIKEENRLLSKRQSIQKIINTLDEKGAKNNLRSYRSSLKGKDVDKLERVRIRAAKELYEINRKNAALVTSPKSPVTRQIKQPKMYDPSRMLESRRIRQANMSSQAGMRVRDIDNKLMPPKLNLDDTKQQLKVVRDRMVELQKAMKKATGREEMNTLKIGLQQARQEAGHLTTRMSKLTREMEKQKFVANSLKDSMRNMARSYVSMFAIIGGAGMAGASGQGLVQARTSLLASTGDAKAAGEAFEFVKEQAMNFGIGIQAATKGYSKISVAAKTAGLSLDQAKEIFLSAAESATAFGLSTEETSGIIKAFSDILSKGTVSAEEVKGQLTH